MSAAGSRHLREPCFSYVDVVHANGTASEPTTFTGCPRLKGDKFTLSARIRVHWLATHPQARMDIMTWGNVLNAMGESSREFNWRDGGLEYGQWDGQCWSAVRSMTGLITDGSWHHVCVTLDGTEVVIYMDGIVCAQGHLKNFVGPDDVSPNLSSGRYRPASYEWLCWHGSIKHVHVYDSVLDTKKLFQQLLVTITLHRKVPATGILEGHCVLSLNGDEFTIDLDADATLEALRFSVEVLWGGRPDIVFLNTQGLILDQDMDLLCSLPGIIGAGL